MSLLAIFVAGFLGAYAAKNQPVSSISEKHQDREGTSPEHYKNLKKDVQDLKEDVSNSLKINNPKNGWVVFDYLFWAAQGNQWMYAERQTNTTSTIFDTKVLRGSCEYSTGGRVELGASNFYDWTFAGVFTYYQNQTHKKSFGSNVYPIQLVDIPDVISSVGTHWQIQYVIGDIQFGCNFDSKTFSIKPFFGMQGAWIKNHEKYRTEGMGYNHNPGVEFSMLRQNHRYLGAGPLLGLKGVCKCGDTGFNFFGLFSTSLLYGTVKSHTLEEASLNDSIFDGEKILQHFKDLKTHLQLIAGCEWKYFFDQKKAACALHIAYEANYWWHQGDKLDFSETGDGRADVPNNEDIIFHGFNFGIEFDY